MDAQISFNKSKVKNRIQADIDQAQKKLDAAVLADSNYFIPKQTSTMEKSGVNNTKIGSGEVIWRTPYVRRQYYGINFDHSRQKNPNACAKWFEAAKARYSKKWGQIVAKYIKHN